MTNITRRAALKLGVTGLFGSVSGIFGHRAVASLPTGDDGIQRSERQKLADIASSFMDKFDVPGLSVAIARHGRIVYREPFGFADRDRGEKLSSDHLFRIASVSKTLTAVAIFTLVQSSQLRLHDRAFGTAEDFKERDSLYRRPILGTDYGTTPYRQYIEKITVDDLLMHTSGGWEKGSFDPMFCKYEKKKERKKEIKDIVDWTINYRPLDYPPGEHWAYSNFGYCILGRIIEAKTNLAYEEYVRRAVLEPSGIKDMRIGCSKREERVPDEVVYYGQNGEDPYDIRLERMDSNGGWIATPTDLVRFAVNVFSDKHQILDTDSIDLMTEPCPVNAAYARGWGIGKDGSWNHSGSLPGTSAVIAWTPPKHGGLCWAAIANTRRPPEETTNRALSDMAGNMAQQVNDWKV
jgi:CubicO group peptidase (beta-lactamase class C family)